MKTYEAWRLSFQSSEAAARAAYAQMQELLKDKQRLDFIQQESVDLNCKNVSTGGDDYEVHWLVIQHHMDKPNERVIGQGFTDFGMRNAIDVAMLKIQEAV